MADNVVLSENLKMRLEFQAEGDVITFRPMGVLDEDTNFSIILETIARMGTLLKGIRFDLGHVKRMNSCGVREWILLMERIISQIPVTFANVNELFIEQANMIPGMFGKKPGKVISFHIPYHCTACNEDASVIVEPQKIPRVNGQPKAPELNCAKCGGKLEFDWIEEDYFVFLGIT